MNTPQIINFKRIGKPSEGYLSIGESNADIPFEIKRNFWTYYTPEEVVRGRHAHYETEMVLIAMAAWCNVPTVVLRHTLRLDKEAARRAPCGRSTT